MSHINLNSPLPAKCEKEKLKGEIAKLREKLEATERSYEATREAALEWKQRAEAAEARINAAEEQEPVAYLNLAVWERTGYNSIYATPDRSFSNQNALYTKPIPPADVQELQHKYDQVDAIASNAADLNNRQAQRIAELERSLADYRKWMHGAKCYAPEELTTLLAAEYQRGRADERADAEKEEPAFIAFEYCGVFSEKPYAHNAKTVKLYRRPLAQKPLSEELLRFLHGMDNIDGVWFGDIHPAEQGVFWWRKYLPTVAHGITEKKEG